MGKLLPEQYTRNKDSLMVNNTAFPWLSRGDRGAETGSEKLLVAAQDHALQSQ